MTDTGPSGGRPVMSTTLVTLAAAFGLFGLVGGFMLRGGIDGGVPADPPEIRTTEDDRLVAAGTRDGDGAATAGGAEPDMDPQEPSAAPGPPDPELVAIRERLAAERDRRDERRRMAFDSPLAPAAEKEAAARTAPEPPRPPPEPDGSGTDGETGPTWLLARGSVIPAVLETPIDSELPGLVRARVSRDVRDSVTGHRTLIPRGSALTGTYLSDTRSGQRRMSVTWTDLRLPDGRAIGLDRFATVGADGVSGIRGRRSSGFLRALGAAALLDVAGNATRILTGSDGGDAALAALVAGRSAERVTDRYLGELLARGARFRVRAGTVMNVLVEEDLRLPSGRWP